MFIEASLGGAELDIYKPEVEEGAPTPDSYLNIATIGEIYH